MILVVLADTRDIGDDWDVERLEDIRVSDTGTLENLWRAERTGRDDDELGCLDDLGNRL